MFAVYSYNYTQPARERKKMHIEPYSAPRVLVAQFTLESDAATYVADYLTGDFVEGRIEFE